MSNGVVPAAIEDLDAQAVAITAVRFPVALPGRGFCMIVETGGYEREPRYGREELLDTVRTSLAIRLGLEPLVADIAAVNALPSRQDA